MKRVLVIFSVVFALAITDASAGLLLLSSQYSKKEVKITEGQSQSDATIASVSGRRRRRLIIADQPAIETASFILLRRRRASESYYQDQIRKDQPQRQESEGQPTRQEQLKSQEQQKDQQNPQE